MLDIQVNHLNDQSLEGLGAWLSRKWYQCQERKLAAERTLQEVGLPHHVLRMEWQEQIHCQTKPLPRMCLLYSQH